MTAPSSTTAVHRVTVLCRAQPRPGNRLGGYAAVFSQTADLGWLGRERLAPGVFDAVLRDPATDVRALWNHNPQLLLGRQSVGTLRLDVDRLGLAYDVDLPDTSYARDVRALAERGDLDGASFAFVPGEWDEDGDVIVHTRVRELVDVAPVTFPAYPGASTEARSLDVAGAGRRRASALIRARHRARQTRRYTA